MNNLSSPSHRPTREEHATSMMAYRAEGERLAKEVGNRGPLKFCQDGNIHPDILTAYWEKGFYVIEDVIKPDELTELRIDANNMIARAPINREAKVDAEGRPAMGLDQTYMPYTFIKPLSDPWGGTDLLGGRHPSQMTQPKAADDAPADVLYLMRNMCQNMPSGLRLYGHPQLLAIAAAINGDDFVPFNDAIFVKQPGLGGSVAWHQDGVTHWDNPRWEEGIHGFNFQIQLYPSTSGNCLWVVPGTHKLGRIDIKHRVKDNDGSDMLPGAIPLTCAAGDVTIVNRQCLHGSFANTTADLRISLTFGFHRRSSVLGQTGALSVNADDLYDEKRVFERSAVIAVAINARTAHHSDETPFHYQPFTGLEDKFQLTDEIFDRVIRDYNLKDLAI